MPLDSRIKGKRKGVLGTLSTLNIYSLLHFPRILGDGKNVFNFFFIIFENFIRKDEVFHGLLLNIIFLRVSILIIVTSPILIQHNPYKNQASFAQVIDPIYSHASYFGKSIGLNKRTVPINRTVSSKWHQRVGLLSSCAPLPVYNELHCRLCIAGQFSFLFKSQVINFTLQCESGVVKFHRNVSKRYKMAFSQGI